MPELSHVPASNGLTWRELGTEIKRQTSEHHLMIFAGNLAFRAFLSLFPLFVLVLSLLGAFHASDFVNRALNRASTVLPEEAVTLLRDQLLGITQARAGGAFTFGAIIASLVALWGVSGIARVLMQSCNVMYGVTERRGFVRKYAVSIGLALVEVVLVVAALLLVGIGSGPAHAIGDWIGLGDAAVITWQIVRWPIVFVVMLIALELVYWIAPNVDLPFRPWSPGTVAASVLWILFSLVFALYVNNFGSYNATYGTFAGIVVLLFYAMYAAAIVLLGAEINHVVYDQSRSNPIHRWWHRVRS